MSDAAKVTRADREAAVEALRECGPSVEAWVPHGRQKKGLVFNTDLLRVAQAIADVRAATAVAVTKAVLDLYLSRDDISWESAVRDLEKISTKYVSKEDT